MASVIPFPAVRPRPDLASRVCELPYDVLSSDEARRVACDNPWSFLRISKPEIELPAGTRSDAPEIYARGRENWLRWIREGALVREDQPAYYVYRQVSGDHCQAGFVGLASCEEYLRGVIRKHELTRPDKETDRTRHLEALNAQTGPAFLIYRANPDLRAVQERVMAGSAEVDFTAVDGVRHTAWSVRDGETLTLIESGFREVDRLYIADGHHRSAAAARVYEARCGADGSDGFLSVLFPHDEVRVLGYHRVLLDAQGRTPADLLVELEARFEIEPGADAAPRTKHELGLYLNGRWYRVRFRPELTGSEDAVSRLDASLLQAHVLAPLFGIQDPRTNQRIQFVGGIRGLGELERLVDGGTAFCAFALYPTSVDDLMAIADTGGIMPPKSTWFEPKLRDGMFGYEFRARNGEE